MADQSDPITNLTVELISGNYIKLVWDEISAEHRYQISRQMNDGNWVSLGTVDTNYFFDSPLDNDGDNAFPLFPLTPSNNYVYSISAFILDVLDVSEAVITSIITTQPVNAFSTVTATNSYPFLSFTANKFVNYQLPINTADYNFNFRYTTGSLFNQSKYKAVLMNANYNFDRNKTVLADLYDDILRQKSYKSNYGALPIGCSGGEKSIAAYWEKADTNYIIIFEKKQETVRYSKDNGKTYKVIRGLPGRAGNPTHDSIYTYFQNELVVLGWDKLFILEPNLKYSNDTVTFSDDITTFQGIDTTNDLVFNKLSDYPPGSPTPGSLNAIGADNHCIYVSANNFVYRICPDEAELITIDAILQKENIVVSGTPTQPPQVPSVPQIQELKISGSPIKPANILNSTKGLYDFQFMWNQTGENLRYYHYPYVNTPGNPYTPINSDFPSIINSGINGGELGKQSLQMWSAVDNTSTVVNLPINTESPTTTSLLKYVAGSTSSSLVYRLFNESSLETIPRKPHTNIASGTFVPETQIITISGAPNSTGTTYPRNSFFKVFDAIGTRSTVNGPRLQFGLTSLYYTGATDASTDNVPGPEKVPLDFGQYLFRQRQKYQKTLNKADAPYFTISNGTGAATAWNGQWVYWPGAVTTVLANAPKYSGSSAKATYGLGESQCDPKQFLSDGSLSDSPWHITARSTYLNNGGDIGTFPGMKGMDVSFDFPFEYWVGKSSTNTTNAPPGTTGYFTVLIDNIDEQYASITGLPPYDVTNQDYTPLFAVGGKFKISNSPLSNNYEYTITKVVNASAMQCRPDTTLNPDAGTLLEYQQDVNSIPQRIPKLDITSVGAGGTKGLSNVNAEVITKKVVPMVRIYVTGHPVTAGESAINGSTLKNDPLNTSSGPQLTIAQAWNSTYSLNNNNPVLTYNINAQGININFNSDESLADVANRFRTSLVSQGTNTYDTIGALVGAGPYTIALTYKSIPNIWYKEKTVHSNGITIDTEVITPHNVTGNYVTSTFKVGKAKAIDVLTTNEFWDPLNFAVSYLSDIITVKIPANTQLYDNTSLNAAKLLIAHINSELYPQVSNVYITRSFAGSTTSTASFDITFPTLSKFDVDKSMYFFAHPLTVLNGSDPVYDINTSTRTYPDNYIISNNPLANRSNPIDKNSNYWHRVLINPTPSSGNATNLLMWIGGGGAIGMAPNYISKTGTTPGVNQGSQSTNNMMINVLHVSLQEVVTSNTVSQTGVLWDHYKIEIGNIITGPIATIPSPDNHSVTIFGNTINFNSNTPIYTKYNNDIINLIKPLVSNPSEFKNNIIQAEVTSLSESLERGNGHLIQTTGICWNSLLTHEYSEQYQEAPLVNYTLGPINGVTISFTSNDILSEISNKLITALNTYNANNPTYSNITNVNNIPLVTYSYGESPFVDTLVGPYQGLVNTGVIITSQTIQYETLTPIIPVVKYIIIVNNKSVSFYSNDSLSTITNNITTALQSDLNTVYNNISNPSSTSIDLEYLPNLPFYYGPQNYTQHGINILSTTVNTFEVEYSYYEWDNFLSQIVDDSTIKVKRFVTIDNVIYVLAGGWDPVKETWIPNINQGVYAFNNVNNTWTLVKSLYYANYSYDINTLNISRNEHTLILGDFPENYDVLLTDDITTEFIDPDFNGVTFNPENTIASNITSERPVKNVWKNIPRNEDIVSLNILSPENWHYEDQYIWNNNTESRIWINDMNNISVIHPERIFDVRLTNTSEKFTDGTLSFFADKFKFDSFNGYTSGAVVYDELTEKLVCFNKLSSLTKSFAEFNWLKQYINTGNGIVIEGILNYVKPVIVETIPEECDEPRDCIPLLEPFRERLIPEHYLYDEPNFIEFIRVYLEYLSDSSYSNYGMLYNLIKNHDINDSRYIDFTSIFETDLMKRNTIVTSEKRNQLNKFLHNTAVDFYSIKGTEDSYKFLFQLLYNVDVNVKIENDYNFVYLVDVELGTPINKVTGQEVALEKVLANLKQDFNEFVSSTEGYETTESYLSENTPTERFFGHIVLATPIDSTTNKATLSLVDQYGVLEEGKQYVIDLGDIYVVTNIIRRSTGNLIDIEYKNFDLNNNALTSDSNAYNYVIRIESPLPISAYKDDVIRFVHPVGFDFIGSYLIASASIANVPSHHIETIINFLQTLKWDSGIPLQYPLQIVDTLDGLDINGNINNYDVTLPLGGRTLTDTPFSLGGQSFPASGEDEETIYGAGGSTYASNEATIDDTAPEIQSRRKNNSPLFDSSWGRMYERADINNPLYGALFNSISRLKDNLENPADPSATQRKIE